LILCESDIASGHQVVNECRELWADPSAWREHLVEGASRLTGMTVAHYAEIAIPTPASVPRCLFNVAVGMPRSSDWKVYEASLTAYPNLFDFFVGSRRLLSSLDDRAPGEPAVALRQELCPDRRWYRSEVFNEFRRPVRGDDNVISVLKRGPGLFTMLDVNQNSGDARATERTKRQLGLLHRLIEPLIGTELATEQQRSMHGLSPQLRTTLEHLLHGKAEKRIAAELGLRLPTVHEYVGKLYRHFGVQSRAELMASFIRRRPRAR
jgi:DNA-binding CsgD family transcriptional regulator